MPSSNFISFADTSLTPVDCLLYGRRIPLLQPEAVRQPPVWTLGDVIRKARQLRGWTQEQLATEADVNPISVVRLERTPERAERSTIESVARALDFPLSMLYRYVEHSTLFAELTEVQQSHVIDLERRLAEKNRAPGQKANAPRLNDRQATTDESAQRARVQRRK